MSPEPGSPPPARGELDPRDYSRRTLLANERTFLAWWRTGITAIAAGLAAAQLVPRIAEPVRQWPYTVVGVALALAGTLCIGYGEWRRIAVDRAVRRGDFAEVSGPITGTISAVGVLIGLGLAVLILVNR